jgi:DNA-directed RNA polymerase specialized sigma24 family protein
MAPRPEGMTLDRVDNDAGYSPANCRWVDRLTQARNRAQAILTDAQRNEIVTRYLDGQTPKNIAGTMGVRVSQVKNTAYGHLRREKIKGVAK